MRPAPAGRLDLDQRALPPLPHHLDRGDAAEVDDQDRYAFAKVLGICIK